MKFEEQLRKIEDRLTALEKERCELLTDLKILRSQNEELTPKTLLGEPTLMAAPDSNEEKAELFLTLFRGRRSI